MHAIRRWISAQRRPFTVVVSSAIIGTACPRCASAALPPEFEDVLVASVTAPTALAFTPDGRLLITTQPGQLRVYANDMLQPTTVLDLSATLCPNSERGLLGIAVDPSFATNRFVYLYYTFKKFGVCPGITAQSPVNRVSRFTLADSNTIDRASELVLIDNIPSPAGNHNAGDLQFGHDGYLYVSVGDGGCDYLGDSGCAQDNDASRDEHVLVGKILRITKTGGIPADNPFQGAGSVRCNVTGRASPGQRCQETFARGLRNPFRMAFDPNASGTRFYINDVGQNTWEEIDLGIAGADYGWNVREGHCATGSTTNCGAPPAGMTNPIFDYVHGSGCAAITGGAFVPDGVWPPAYNGAYLFGDYVCGSIFALTRASDGSLTRTVFATGLGASSAVTLVFGPYGGSQALYYTTYANGGQVRRIAAAANRSPTVVVSASATSGQLPLAVRFDGSRTTDPDGDALTFDWNFDDGTPHATTAIATHTYNTAGRFVATLTVRDSRGAAASATVAIDAGNRPPAPSIVSPGASARFAVGQTITLRGTATDPEDGVLSDVQLSWTVVLHHNTHTHPFVTAPSANNVTFQAPAPEDLAATSTSYLEILLTATDSSGSSATISQKLEPKIVDVTFETDPVGLSIGVNGAAITGPTTVKSWQNHALRVSAATQNGGGNARWLFSGWNDGGPAAHTILTPSSSADYVVRFTPATATPPTADAYVRSGTSASANFGVDTVLLTKLSSAGSATRQAYLEFDLRNVTAVGTALLRLYGSIDDTASANVKVAASPVASTLWNESTITWNTKPRAGSSPIATTTVVNATPGWYEWNVTTWLRAEVGAGHTTGSLVLQNPSATSSRVQFNSREAAANRPELVVSGEMAGGLHDVVMYAQDASVVRGAWGFDPDLTAAGGMRLRHPDARAAKLTSALASPVNFFEITFTAEARTAYRLWIRGRADANSYSNDSVYVQFSDAVSASGAAVYRMNTASATTYVLEDCSGCGEAGWGWQDNGYGTGVLGPPIYFAGTGTHTIRVQTREDGLSIDQIVLSPGKYLTMAPGRTTNDTTIVPR